MLKLTKKINFSVVPKMLKCIHIARNAHSYDLYNSLTVEGEGVKDLDCKKSETKFCSIRSLPVSKDSLENCL